MDNNSMVSLMRDITRFQDDETLKDYLALQLLHGRLALILGAGASFGFGLPNWDTLTRRAFELEGRAYPVGTKNEDAAEILLNTHCAGDEVKFANVVRNALYEKYSLSFESLRKNDLLAAIGAIAMASRRGSVSRIISFNFDDTLEVYLNFFGFIAESVADMPAWSTNADIKVYHPHGLLPNNKGTPIQTGIVFAQAHYDKIIGDSKDSWRNALLDICRSNTCIFIGLSGNDTNLTNILFDVKKTHVSIKRGDVFWGIRFSDDMSDPKKSIWEGRGVFHKAVRNYSDIPLWLFDICQRAAQIHRSSYSISR